MGPLLVRRFLSWHEENAEGRDGNEQARPCIHFMRLFVFGVTGTNPAHSLEGRLGIWLTPTEDRSILLRAGPVTFAGRAPRPDGCGLCMGILGMQQRSDLRCLTRASGQLDPASTDDLGTTTRLDGKPSPVARSTAPGLVAPAVPTLRSSPHLGGMGQDG